MSSATAAAAHESSSTLAEPMQQLSPAILRSYERIARDRDMRDYELLVQPIGGPGENSYGSVLKVQVLCKQTTEAPPSSLHTILKIAPTNAARRAHQRVKAAYTREVFIYARIFEQYYALAADNAHATPFSAVPRMLHASLDDGAEFIIFEDLTHAGYALNSRANLPTYDLVVCAFRALAQLHAMSFVLQARRPQLHATLVAQMDDNLFTADTAPVTIEFGRKYVRRTRHMLEEDACVAASVRALLSQALQQIEQHYKEICLDAVNGAAAAPYAVICHGDFWNNNILYEYERANGAATRAKLIDFQISRYAAPVLDLMHYLYACTEKPLRDAHFHTFMQIYHSTLAAVLATYQLDVASIYPQRVFERQLRDYGVYGFCMSALSIPFFVSNASELPELDVVCEAIQELSSSSDSSDTEDNNSTAQKNENAVKLVDDYDLLTARTLPLFKQRMIGNVLDMHKYQMLDKVMLY